MNNFILGVLSAALFVGFVWFAQSLFSGEDEGPLSDRDPGKTLPEFLAAVACSDGGWELLLCPREPDPELRNSLDDRLLRRLGVEEPQSWRLYHLLASHTGPDEQALSGDELRLRTLDGSVLQPRLLTSLTDRRDPATRLQLGARGAEGAGPLAPGALRRQLVALPRDLDLTLVTSGEFRGLALVTGSVDTLPLIEWLEAENPRTPWLATRFQAGRAATETPR